MDFLYLFDLLKFDVDGHICGTTESDERKAKSNFLYLISKYNQKFLDDGEKVPEFFKTELADVLKKVEEGGDFEKAKELVLKNCKKVVVEAGKNARNEMAIVLKLNSELISRESEFADEFGRAVNNIQLAYIITSISGKLFEEILSIQKEDVMSQKDRSRMFKKVIEYNCLIKMASLVKENRLSKEELCRYERVAEVPIFLKKFAVNT